MKPLLSNLVLFALTILVTSPSSAEVVTEASVVSGYQSNLFGDSNSAGDTYASLGLGLKYYPSASTQIATAARYNAFADYGDLSNLTGDLSITIIPTPETSPFSVAMSGAASGRKFGPQYELYNRVGTTVGLSLRYRVMSWVHLQSSGSYLNDSYTNSDYGSNRGYDLSTGVNFTLPGSNSFALRADYSSRSFDQPAEIQIGVGNSPTRIQDRSETFDITGVLLRFSRPLGQRTGVSLSVGHRRLHMNNDYTVLGYTIDYLSPWTDLWEGMSLSGSLKHFFPKQITTEFSFAHFEKDFVDVIELGDTAGETYWQDTRSDRLTTISLSVSKPLSLQDGKQFTPSIFLGYRRNESTTGFFAFEDILASISLAIGL